MTELLCSLCGGAVVHALLLSSPPQDQYRCLKCETTKTIAQPIPPPVIIDMSPPFEPTEEQIKDEYEDKPAQYDLGHPKG